MFNPLSWRTQLGSRPEAITQIWALLISSVRKGKYVLRKSADSGVPINLLNGVPQRNHVAPRRLRGLAARVFGKFCLVYPQEKFTLLS
jgi:hypothetical protein